MDHIMGKIITTLCAESLLPLAKTILNLSSTQDSKTSNIEGTIPQDLWR